MLTVLGASHHDLELTQLERLAARTEELSSGLAALSARVGSPVAGLVLVSTCNRLEIYLDALRFHDAIDAVGEVVAETAGMRTEDVVALLKVRVGAPVAAHLFSVTAGLDSMVVGEAEIAGQVARAFRDAQTARTTSAPINLLFQVYHFMFGIGSLLVPIGLLGGLLYLWKRRLFETRWMLWLLVLTVFAGEAAITAGWWTAEVGRQPWIVYNVLATADGVSPVLGSEELIFSIAMFVALYALLLALFLFLLNRKIQEGPEELEDVETVPVGNLPDTFRDIFSRHPRAG
jgi:Cytochrome bd-type quinol oxidase, subunit 1